MARRARVDAELVRRGLARSRQQAAELIGAGRVSIDGMPAAKPATAVAVSAALTVDGADERSWVSRGAHKLMGALDTFGLAVEDRRCLDAGASTGGFTEVLLDRGAREVVAVDVGYGQLAWSLRNDPRVTVMERTNVRELTADAIGGPVDLVVADLSFISLSTVLPALTSCAMVDADIVPMVKPQFEVGKNRVGAGGVVSDPDLRADAVLRSPAAPRNWTGTPSPSPPVRCPAHPATSSTFCGCGRGPTVRCKGSRSNTQCGARSRRVRNELRTSDTARGAHRSRRGHRGGATCAESTRRQRDRTAGAIRRSRRPRARAPLSRRHACPRGGGRE